MEIISCELIALIVLSPLSFTFYLYFSMMALNHSELFLHAADTSADAPIPFTAVCSEDKTSHQTLIPDHLKLHLMCIKLFQQKFLDALQLVTPGAVTYRNVAFTTD